MSSHVYPLFPSLHSLEASDVFRQIAEGLHYIHMRQGRGLCRTLAVRPLRQFCCRFVSAASRKHSFVLLVCHIQACRRFNPVRRSQEYSEGITWCSCLLNLLQVPASPKTTLRVKLFNSWMSLEFSVKNHQLHEFDPWIPFMVCILFPPVKWPYARGIAHRDLKPENVLVLDRSWEDPMVTPQARPETSRAGQDLR